ncbi:hypothetical protein GCM10010420_37650 [Streptomyces glaucosporus]|uniref:HIT domain-containing protein n=1 Tax=Streptomyces glaucosporus TaxID=284044 RepID=A0ABN3IL43_9ACTN
MPGPEHGPARSAAPGEEGGVAVDGCVFCAIGRGEADADLVAYRSGDVCVVPALLQRENNPGRTLVLPVPHVTGLDGTPPGLLREVFGVAARVVSAVREAYGAVGSTVVQNNTAPGQVLHHLHVSVVPRFEGDAFRIPEPGLSEAPREVRLARASALRRVLAREA